MAKVKTATRIAFKKEPEKGERGERGPQPRMRKYVVGVEYQCGGEGDEYIDRAFYNGYWYRCLVTHTPTGNANPYDEIGHGYNTWAVETQFNFFASGVLAVGENGDGWIIDGAQIKHTNGKVVLDMDGSANWNNKTIISPEGIFYSKGGVFEGRLQLPFVELTGDTTFSENTGSAISLGMYNLTLPTDSKYDGYVLEIISANVITKLAYRGSLSGRIILPWLTQENGVYRNVYVATFLEFTYGGYVRLLNRRGTWIVISHTFSDAYYTGAYELNSIFG